MKKSLEKEIEIDERLHEFFNELLNEGVSPALLTFLLCRHAMEISLSLTNETDKIFFNILSGLIGPASDRIDAKPKCLSTDKDKAVNDNNPKKLTIQ